MDKTIKDIAKKADVSYATVSRALNNKKGVNSRTRERILTLAKKLNYRPNAIARGLVKKQTYTLGLIIPDITNPFFSEVARGIEDQANKSKYSVFLCNTNWEIDRQTRHLNLLIEKRVDGVIIAPITHNINSLRDALRGRIPVVYVSNTPPNPENSFVIIDNIRGGFLATKHLIEAGYKSIGFIGSPEDSLTTTERFEGYKLAFEKYGMQINDRYIQLGDFRCETGYNIIKRMIEKNNYPNAMFAENDLLALGVIQGVKEMGLTVPKDVAVVGFDDIPLASFPEIQLTTVSQPKYEMGRIAAQILLERLTKDKQEALPKRVILEPRLIVRKSS